MPPKRHTADKKQQAAAQDNDEIQIRPGSHGLDSPGLTGLGTGPGLPGSKPEWLEAVLDGLTNKFSLLMDSKLSNLDMKLSKHVSSIEANVSVLKREILDLRERQVESSSITKDLVARFDGLEKQLIEQENKVKILEDSLDDLKN